MIFLSFGKLIFMNLTYFFVITTGFAPALATPFSEKMEK